MSNLILVRHGQSLWNKERRFTGWADINLTDDGKFEAKKAGMSTSAYANKVLKKGSKADARTKKQASLAKTLGKMRKKRG